MTAIDGFRLDFNSGSGDDVFRASENVQVTHQTQPLFLIDGLRNAVKFYNDYIDDGGQPGRADSNYAALFEGFGAGVHTVEITFQMYEGSTDTWGDANDGDSPTTKMQVLNRKITTTRVTSDSPGLLEVGEYNNPDNFSGISSSLYDPIPVALGEANLSFTPEEQVSDFTGSMTFYEAVDAGQAVDAIFR